MAQTPEGEGTSTTPPIQDPRWVTHMSQIPAGLVFRPSERCLVDSFLITRALHGAIKTPHACIEDGVDVYAVRPEALPFLSRNRGLHGHVWAYFYTTRPAGGVGDEGGGGDGDDVREVAVGGCWRRYGREKGYVGRDREVYAFRRKFAFHEPGARRKKTVWRMKEFRLKETAPTFRDAVFHPDAKGLVICKVYNEVIPKEEPAVDYYGNGIKDGEEEEEDEEEIGPVVITVGDAAAAPNA